MKLTTIILVLVTSANAYIEQTELADGKVVARWIEDGEPQLEKRTCNHNNCLRAMIARPLEASAFCQTFTTAPSLADNPFTNCAKATKASTACTCFAPVHLVR